MTFPLKMEEQQDQEKNDSLLTPEQLSPGLREILGLIMLAKVISGFSSAIYICKKLKVSIHVKRILLSEAVFLIAETILMTVGYVQVTWLRIKDSISCGLLVDLIPLTLMFHILLTMMLAKLRYKMAEAIGNQKVVDDGMIQKRFWICLSLCLSLIVVLMLMSSLFGIHSSFLAPKCNPTANDKVNFIIVFMLASVVGSIVSFYYDHKLFLFIKEYNARYADVIAPWSTDPFNNVSE